MLKTLSATPRALAILITLHIIIIAASNYLVQIPVKVFGYHTTWGAFTFPFIFLVTDLTVRMIGQVSARKVIFFAMIPALLVSYFFSTAFFEGKYIGTAEMMTFNLFIFRIVLASFIAYVVGQLLDIFVFNRLRQLPQWWVAPVASTFFGTLVDAICFFSIAFYRCDDAFMAAHWIEIGAVDYVFKVGMGLFVFVPAYGVILEKLQSIFAIKTSASAAV